MTAREISSFFSNFFAAKSLATPFSFKINSAPAFSLANTTKLLAAYKKITSVK